MRPPEFTSSRIRSLAINSLPRRTRDNLEFNPPHNEFFRREVSTIGFDHGAPARRGRVSLGPRADVRHHQTLHAGRDLRGAGRHRSARLAGPCRGVGRLPAAGCLLRADGRGAEPFPDRRRAGCDQPEAGAAASARLRRAIGGDRGRCEADLGRGEGGREKRERAGRGDAAGRRAAGAAGAGGGAADRLARRGRGLRLGERRAGDREAARRAGRVRRGAHGSESNRIWKTRWAICFSCW